MAEEVISSSAEGSSSFGAAILSTVPTSTAVVASSAVLHTIIPVAGTAEIVSSVVLHQITPLTSAAVVASTLLGSSKTAELVASGADVQSAVAQGVELSLSSAAVVASAALLRHFAIISDSVAVGATATAKLTSILASAAIVADAATLAASMQLSSTADLASAFGAFTLGTAATSAGVVVDTALPVARVTRELTSAAVVAPTLAMRLLAKQTLVSAGVAESFVRLSSEAIQTYWTNARTTGAAKWTSLHLNSVVEIDGVLYGAGVDGVHELTDAGAHEGEVMWDLLNFGTPQLKTVDSVYMSGTAGGAMTVRAMNQDGAWEYATHLTDPTTKSVNHRATLGRGLKAVDYRISIKAGHAFDISDVHLQVAETKRRIGG